VHHSTVVVVHKVALAGRVATRAEHVLALFHLTRAYLVVALRAATVVRFLALLQVLL